MKSTQLNRLAIALVIALIMPFIAQANFNNAGKKPITKIEKKANNKIADGTYIKDDPGFTIALTYKANKLTKFVINGQVQNLKTAPKQVSFKGTAEGEKQSIAKALNLQRGGYECVCTYKLDSQKDKTKSIWVVFYDNAENCWYEKYKQN